MAKLSQAQVKEKADEWVRLGGQIDKAEQALVDELRPYEEKFEKVVQPIREKHEKKITKLEEKRDRLSDEIYGWLNAQDKTVSLETETAVAAVELKVGSRVIDPHKFFEKAKDKGAAAWECVTVAIAKAEKLLGRKTVDEISTKDSKLVASLKAK